MEGDRVEPADERRHRPGAGRAWEESWYLDFADGETGLGGYVRLALHPADGMAWFWAGVVGAGPPLVTVRDHEVPLPTGGGLEVRASGLWTELVCETPLDHWSVGLEAFGVALDDPLEAWGRERGDPWAIGLDVEWEALGPCRSWPSGYWQPCAVSGDLLVGTDRFQLDCRGVRQHLWGDRGPSAWAAGALSDGTSFAAAAPDATVETGADGLLASAAIAPLGLSATPLAHAPVLVPATGRLARALCRYEAGDGRVGCGWAERLS